MYEPKDLNEKNLEMLFQKKMIEVNTEIAKQQQTNEIKDTYAQRREARHEFQRESRKTQYYEVIIKKSGKLILETRNSWINIMEREVANFKFLGLFPLVSSDGDGGISALSLEITGEEKCIYIANSKAGKEGYLLRKITDAGGKVYANSKSVKQNFLMEFWTAIYPLRTDMVTIPTHVGWISEGKNQFKFVERGTKLWDEFVRDAK